MVLVISENKLVLLPAGLLRSNLDEEGLACCIPSVLPPPQGSAITACLSSHSHPGHGKGNREPIG